MGVEFYLLHADKKEYCYLGRNWFDFEGFGEHWNDKAAFVDEVVDHHGKNGYEGKSFSKVMGAYLYDWCDKRDWKVTLASDHSSDFPIREEGDGWKETGDITSLSVISQDEIMKKVLQATEDLKKAIGADAVAIYAAIEADYEERCGRCWIEEDEEEYRDSKDTPCWEYHAEDGPTAKVSGYRKAFFTRL